MYFLSNTEVVGRGTMTTIVCLYWPYAVFDIFVEALFVAFVYGVCSHERPQFAMAYHARPKAH